jgi:AraC-like DNA-binding protein
LQTDEDFTREDPRVSLVKQYVEDNIFRNITVAELATYCYISEKHLERIFLQNTGCTLMEFVRQRKCREIEKLLSDSSLSIKEISKMMNFSNEYYFNSFFKKNAGMPPGAYRKTVLK